MWSPGTRWGLTSGSRWCPYTLESRFVQNRSTCGVMHDENVLAATKELLPALVAAAEAIATNQYRSSKRRLFAMQQLGR